MPEVRRIAAEAQANDYRMSSLILGVIQSDAFQLKQPATVAQDEAPGN
jgi:hypothetical protein